MPAHTEHVEFRNGGYYVAGTRIGLDVIVGDFRRGCSAESIFEAYPSMGSLAKVYGAITFILENPGEIESYLREQHRIFDEIRTQYPMPEDMRERFEQAKRESSTHPV